MMLPQQCFLQLPTLLQSFGFSCLGRRCSRLAKGRRPWSTVGLASWLWSAQNGWRGWTFSMYCDLVIEPDLVVCATGRGMKKRVDAGGKDVHFPPLLFFSFFFLGGFCCSSQRCPMNGAVRGEKTRSKRHRDDGEEVSYLRTMMRQASYRYCFLGCN